VNRFSSQLRLTRVLTLLAGSLTLFCAGYSARATIDADLQKQLGNPSGATTDPSNTNHYLIVRTVEAIDYNATLGQANWVSWDLTAGDDSGSAVRKDNYTADSSLPAGWYRVTDSDYSGSGWTRGHMCPSGDRMDTQADNDLLFLMSNIIPQAATVNSGPWERLETDCRVWADAGNEVLIICGPSRFTGATMASGHIAIPGYNWKVVVVVPPDGTNSAISRINYNTRVVAINVTNSSTISQSSPWSNYVTSVNQIQTETGFTFFTALSSNLAAVLRSKVDGQAPPAPSIASFSPASGNAGATVTITGTGLNFTTNVTFNGTPAAYSIVSGTNLVATVPSGAASGQIRVATLGGAANSTGSFVMGTGGVADLAVISAHSGAFTQGDVGDTYTIIVTNLGTAASSGTITVSNALPAGLTATAASGTGWGINLATLTCTSANALLPGAALPAITLTVNVGTAAASGTNWVVVSGGGETNTANNTASDATTVNVAAAPAVATGTANGLGTTTATLNGTVNPDGQPAAVRFDYGLTTAYGSAATLSGSLTGNTAQAVSTSLTGLLASTTYHFRVGASNIIGSVNGLDQTFTTTAAGVPDLAVFVTHAGSFTQGDTADTYSLIVSNIGNAASSGSVTVMDALPSGLTATAISGPGWSTNLATLTCTRSDTLAAGMAYPAITLTVSVASDAPASVINSATVSGGGETNLANNTALDSTTISPPVGGGPVTTLVGWDVHSLPGGSGNYGDSPLAPTTNAANLTLGGLTRGSGVTTSGTAAGRAWGGTGWTDASSAAAISSNRFATFTVAANPGYRVSFSAISTFDCRHSATGPATGLLQYQVGTAAFADVGTLSYPTNTSGGGSIGPIDLSTNAALQNVAAGTTVTFRIVNYGGSSSSGTWYIYDVANTNTPDLAVQGTVSPVVVAAPDLTVGLTHSDTFTQGDIGRTYTITVTNSGSAATISAVTVTNLLPAGLTATAISGNGWTTNLSTRTCTRADSLAAGQAYPPITVTVNVSGSAATSLTNVAVVTGGGETSTANNTATDPTTILPAAVPAVTTVAASAVGSSGAMLRGMVNPNNQATAAGFEFGLTPSYGSVLPVAANLGGATAQAVATNLAGLLPATTYHYRVMATNVLGATNGLDQSFTTLAATPVAVTQPATGVTPGGATVNGSVNPQGAATTWYFQYGLTTSYGSYTPTNTLPAGTSAVALSAALSGLFSGTPYHYQLVASNGAGASLGGDAQFTTVAVPAPQLAAPLVLNDGSLQFSFTSTPGASFSVLGATDPNLPVSSWTVLGPVAEVSPGQYQFTDLQVTNKPLQFYLLRQP
jgi:uncharacterized repeat protein (TIGR01451 family)